MQIDHLTVPVRDYELGKRFYAEVLEPLGYRVLLDWPDKRRVYLGVPGGPSSIWVVESAFAGSLDFSLAVADQGEVANLHTAALAAGARSLIEPGPHPDRTDCYAARVADFDGNVIEAVHRDVAIQRAAA
jgi:catechol 2,3-dioxygenase-like lactoylglutathione lyase family enzyme